MGHCSPSLVVRPNLWSGRPQAVAETPRTKRQAESAKSMNPTGVSMEDLPYQFHLAESVVPQFALSNTPTAILRELVQNEYDAEGYELGVTFESDQMVITGNGNPIDDAGWKRLQVIPGTGWVPNLDTYIEPKKSSLGSKNFGLRALFAVGDQIKVYSDGKWSSLHWQRRTVYPPMEARDSPGLGCRTRPGPRDWVHLISSISQSVGTEGIVSNADRPRLRRAYAELRNGIPDVVGLDGLPFVLGRDGRLRNPNDAY